MGGFTGITAFCCEKVSNALVRMRWDGNCDGRLAGMGDGCDNAGVYGLVFVGSMH